MKGLKKLVLVSAIAAAPLANAELKAVDDATLEAATGQSGLVVEAAFGSTSGDALNRDYTNAGITVEAFKWTVDLEAWDQGTNQTLFATGPAATATGATAGGVTGGLVAQNIAIAGSMDVDIDGVIDANANGGIAMVLNGTVDMKIGNIDTFAFNGTNYETSSTHFGRDTSFGGIEFAGVTLNNVSMVLRGR